MQPADLQRLPDGACLTSLQRHADHRGFLAEVFRRSWFPDVELIECEARGGARDRLGRDAAREAGPSP
jgi:dTDP-4-dehydrorhamnose 3,5-epimerase-like enzyme